MNEGKYVIFIEHEHEKEKLLQTNGNKSNKDM